MHATTVIRAKAQCVMLSNALSTTYRARCSSTSSFVDKVLTREQHRRSKYQRSGTPGLETAFLAPCKGGCPSNPEALKQKGQSCPFLPTTPINSAFSNLARYACQRRELVSTMKKASNVQSTMIDHFLLMKAKYQSTTIIITNSEFLQSPANASSNVSS